MNTAAKRVLIVSVTCVIGLAFAVCVVRSRRSTHMQLVDKGAEVELLLLERQLDPRGIPAISTGAESSTTLAREPLNPERVNEIFVLGGFLVYDPFTYYRYASNLEETWPLPEHPGGHYVRRTNSTGEREDHDTFVTQPDVFVLVAGDSHTDGLCDNAESYANLLEERLKRAHPGLAIEVLNTGVQAYSFYNYLGVLEKYSPRGPIALVTAYYGGNDFVEALRPYHYFQHTAVPPPTRGNWNELQRAKQIGADALSQGVNAILYFKRYPDELEVALQAALDVSAEIQRQCEAKNIRWIPLYIPSAFDRPWPASRELRERVMTALELTEYDMGVINRLADRLIARMRERKLDVIDLRDHFSIDGGPWYWSELHINLKGHARVAELLEPRVEAVLTANAALVRSTEAPR
jgi:lysophospholipase L1-like esterase